ncbi:MAG: hypothetical protein JWM81_848 [Candidatus Saccharibacteria bacterium]|nr:hypothetical protein [Candidatus Saccharibacteria bacterium]
MSSEYDPTTVIDASEDLGRRIYIQEQAFVRDGMQSPERFRTMIECAVSLTIPRAYAHAESELDFWEKRAIELPADDLVRDMGYRALQTSFLQGVTVRRVDGSSVTTGPLLGEHEVLVANCYFSNYYTLATSEAAAKIMFSDTSSISSIRDLAPERLTLVSLRNLAQRMSPKEVLNWVEQFDLHDETNAATQNAVDHITANNRSEDVQPLVAAVTTATTRLSGRLHSIVSSFYKEVRR